MAIAKITYTDKEALNIDTSVPEINKCQASDLNEIKSVVNNNADEIPTNERLVNVGTSVDTNYKTNILYSRNLFDKNNANTINAFIYSNKIQTSPVDIMIVIPCEPNTTYTIQKGLNATLTNNRFKVGTCVDTPDNNVELTNYVGYGDGTTITSITITSGANDNYLVAQVANNQTNYDEIKNTIIINKGSTLTTPSINVDGEEIYSKPVVLWTNPSHTSTFAPQTITLNDNLSNYRYYEILFYNGTANTLSFSSGKVLSGTSPSYILYHSGIEAGTVGNIRVRPITSVSDTQIVFDKAYQKVYNSNAITENNALDIPYQVIGYK